MKAALEVEPFAAELLLFGRSCGYSLTKLGHAAHTFARELRPATGDFDAARLSLATCWDAPCFILLLSSGHANL
jgi:hypothetical protein